WLQVGCYRLLGVNEMAARLPSALAALLTVLAVYELGRWMFDRGTAFLAGVILATCVSFQGGARFANPGALLLGCTTLSLGLYWRHWQSGGAWLVASAAVSGLAVLAKGPVGLVLPLGVTLLFLLWQRQLRRLLDRRLGEAVLVFVLVAAPWYILVTAETK